jgi:hypothetical protein
VSKGVHVHQYSSFANLRNAQIPTRIYEIRKVTATIDFHGSLSNRPSLHRWWTAYFCQVGRDSSQQKSQSDKIEQSKPLAVIFATLLYETTYIILLAQFIQCDQLLLVSSDRVNISWSDKETLRLVGVRDIHEAHLRFISTPGVLRPVIDHKELATPSFPITCDADLDNTAGVVRNCDLAHIHWVCSCVQNDCMNWFKCAPRSVEGVFIGSETLM